MIRVFKMKQWLAILLLILTFTGSYGRQILERSRSEMPFGVYYYPEQWDSSQWERDLTNIADLGFEFTHFAEFAWSSLEPEDNKFDFGWLDSCVNIAARKGLKVVMCTPSATPPAWLTEKHPEILVVTAQGRQVKHGMRLNCNGSNPTYQKYIARILDKMIEHYGNHPAVCGWQIDNEPHFEGLYDYSDHAKAGFQTWLQNKYGTIENLNKAWGGAFWSIAYNDYNQINIPNTEEHTSNPHAYIDFKRYNADALASAVSFQADLLRKGINPRQWVTTNFAYYGFLPSVNPFKNKGDLDFASYTMYPMNTFLEYPAGKYGYRLGSGMELSFQTEMFRSVSGSTGVMELQPGQINWGQWNSLPMPGAVSMWLWHTYGLGNDFACTYRYRQPLYGSEQFHKGITEPDGVTLSPGGKEFVETLKEIEKLKPIDKPVPKDVANRRTAFLWKHDNLFSVEHTQVRGDWNLWAPYLGMYKKLKTLGAAVDFVTEDSEFDPSTHPFMIMPVYDMVDKSLIDRLTRYVENGGNLVMTYRTAMKDNDSHLWESKLQAPIYGLAGITVEGFDQLPANDVSHVEFDGKSYGWRQWGDLLATTGNTEVWASHSEGFYQSTPCVTYTKRGKGSVCYIGVMSDDFKLEQDVLRKFYSKAGAKILDLPDYFFIEYRDGYFVAVNYTSEDVELPELKGARIIKGNKTVGPGKVTVWK